MKKWILISAIPALAVLMAPGVYASEPASGKQLQVIKDTVPDGERGNKQKKVEVEVRIDEEAWAKIRREIRQALDEIDLVGLKADVQKAVAKIDVEKIEKDIARSLQDLEAVKIRARVEAEAGKERKEKFKALSISVDSNGLKELRVEIEKVREAAERAARAAGKEVDKAKDELRLHRSFVDQLHADKLIDKNGSYEISHKNGKLVINGVEQSPEVYEKYKSFLDQHQSFEWKVKTQKD